MIRLDLFFERIWYLVVWFKMRVILDIVGVWFKVKEEVRFEMYLFRE